MSIAEDQAVRFPSKPTLWDVEKSINVISQLSSNFPVELILPRKTNSNFFVDTALARLIATLSSRSGFLTVVDHYKSWGERKTQDRFLTEIDGIAALSAAERSDRSSLINLRGEAAPNTLFREFHARLIRTALAKESGSVRTYIALDPKNSVPLELGMENGRLSFLRRYISQLPSQFGERALKKTYEQMAALDEIIYSFVFELFQNTYEHGRIDPQGRSTHGVRYILFRRHIATSSQVLAQRSGGFEELQQYFSERKGKRFLEISIGDAGQGILAHYRNAHKIALRNSEESSRDLLNRILTSSLTSKQLVGAGRGLPIALNALTKLNAFVSLRTDDQWLFGNFSQSASAKTDELKLTSVKTLAPISSVVGTHFNILVDF